MQISLSSAIYKNNVVGNYRHSSKPVETKLTQYSDKASYVSFYGTVSVQKTVTSQITSEKNRLLRILKEILSTNVPKISFEEKFIMQLDRAIAQIRRVTLKEDELIDAATRIMSDRFLNDQQKIDRIRGLNKEFNRLSKLKINDVQAKQPSKDNYDYALINKFKNAVLNDEYNFSEIYEEHYRPLKDIQTAEEFREKYPLVRIPQDPRDVIAQKIHDTLDRNFYIDLDEISETHSREQAAFLLVKYFDKYFSKIKGELANRSVNEIWDLFGMSLSEKIKATMLSIKDNDCFEIVPEKRINKYPVITKEDRLMLDLDYDKLLLNTLKVLYLDGKKLNQIVYDEKGKKIPIQMIKSPEYRFEKVPEKLKSLFADARKIQSLQRNYQKFTADELKARLNYYTSQLVGNNEEIFDRIVDFDGCKFTEEDRQYAIKFLEVLDKVYDKLITTEDAARIIKENNLYPHGTVKLNEIERKELEKKIKLEKEKNLKINNLRESFRNSLNQLYGLGLTGVAERFSKYYPESGAEPESINETKKVLDIINKSFLLKDSEKVRAFLLRWEVFNEYLQKHSNSKEFLDSIDYAKNFAIEEKEYRSGQYLLKREMVRSYPTSLDSFDKPKIFEKIMDKFGDDENLATIYLCKYENYLSLNESERLTINKILEIFSDKDSDDRIILKNIIENDYVNADTIYINPESNNLIQTSIASKAKKAILAKYKFPGCIDLFQAFEDAMKMSAKDYGRSGIKRTGSNNNALDYKIELKIKGYPDRLFSSNNDFCFDIYSEKGLH